MAGKERFNAEVRLATSSKEREKYDNMADLFAIFVCTDQLEKAYIRDWVDAERYTAACLKLIAQYNTARDALVDYVPDVRQFLKEYNLDCPAAVKRLVDVGVPATALQSSGKPAARGQEIKLVAQTVQNLITLANLVTMNRLAKDQIYPALSDLMVCVKDVSALPRDFEPKVKLTKWLILVNKLQANDALNDVQARQLLFDVEQFHTEFLRAIEN